MWTCEAGASGAREGHSDRPVKSAAWAISAVILPGALPARAQIIIADCLPGYHNPPGHPEICVPDAATAVPALSDAGLVILIGLLALVGVWRRKVG